MDDNHEELLQNNPEINRLREQVEFSIEKEKIFWDLAGINDGMKILEIGCGPGWMTKHLLKKYPNSTVTGTDINSKYIEFFPKIMTRRELERTEIIKDSIIDTSLPSNAFDVAIVRVVLQYVDNPKHAIKQIFNVLKPGGIVFVIDIDTSFSITFDPPIPNYSNARDKILKYLDENNYVKSKLARYFPKYFKNAGFTNIQMQSITSHSDLQGIDSFLNMLHSQKTPNYYEEYIKKGILTTTETEWAIKDIENFLDNQNKMAFGVIFVCYGIKAN